MRSTFVGRTTVLTLLFVGSSVCANQDPSLEGCWRSQQVEMTMPDMSVLQANSDCVIQYTATQAYSRCHTETGRTESLSAYEVAESGQLRITPLDSSTGKPKAAAAIMRYRIEGEWLLVDRQFPPSTSAESGQYTRVRSVSVRIPIVGNARCEPHGETGVRVGRTPKSSLLISTPPGWQPLLLDPATDKRLGSAVNSSLFVGAFIPSNATAERPETYQLIVVLDDTRPGPVPVQAERFESVKRQFSGEFKRNQITCDQPDRVCASLPQPNGSYTYTELVNIRGRVAVITGAMAQEVPNAGPLLEKAVQRFVAKLREENEN